jgi:hypothetical protein
VPDAQVIGLKFQSEIDFRLGQVSIPETEAGLLKVLQQWEAETRVG